MTVVNREVKESPFGQGKDESKAYALTTTPWGSSPTSVTVKIYNSAGTDMSSTNLSGSVSVSGDVITTPLVTALTAGERYRLEFKFTCSSNIFEAYVYVIGED
jgi:hypothetical protein